MYIININNLHRNEQTLYQVNNIIFPCDIKGIVLNAHKEALKVDAYYTKFKNELAKNGIVEVTPTISIEIPTIILIDELTEGDILYNVKEKFDVEVKSIYNEKIEVMDMSGSNGTYYTQEDLDNGTIIHK